MDYEILSYFSNPSAVGCRCGCHCECDQSFLRMNGKYCWSTRKSGSHWETKVQRQSSQNDGESSWRAKNVTTDVVYNRRNHHSQELLVCARSNRLGSWDELEDFIVRGRHNFVRFSIEIGITGLNTNVTKRNEASLQRRTLDRKSIWYQPVRGKMRKAVVSLDRLPLFRQGW